LALFWKLDRFSREGVRKTLRHLEQLYDWGIGWRSFQEPFFDSCGMMRDVVISIMATLAEQERITISERTKAGLARTRKASTRRGRRPAHVDMALVEKRHAGGESLRHIKFHVSTGSLQRYNSAIAFSYWSQCISIY
jgi:DNA invertase Pin-like site-specific DNA recombinase